MKGGRLAIHGHFYQPSRTDPFSGRIPLEPSAAPYADWNARITEEAYRPSAEAGNFARIGWDLGPTLATWLRRERPDVHAAIAAQENGLNGMAQAYHHAILPLASARDRRTEIRWALRDFELRFGHRPAGLWLPETAVDALTLRIAAEEGVRYTILAPWQAASPVDARRPYRVALGRAASIVVVFYDSPLSAAVSFEPDATANADRFARERVLPRLAARGGPRTDGLVLVATDGELYGHHQPFRDLFLARLTRLGGASSATLAITTLGEALDGVDPGRLRPVTVRERTSWSCHHGVARWSAECPDARDGRWKAPLRAALDRLAAAIDAVTEDRLAALGLDAWGARDRYVDVVSEYADAEAWADAELRRAAVAGRAAAARLATSDACAELVVLMAVQRSRLLMFASDGWFWEDPTRPETAQVLRAAAHAVRTLDGHAGTRLEDDVVRDLAAVGPSAGAPGGHVLYATALTLVGQPPPRPT